MGNLVDLPATDPISHLCVVEPIQGCAHPAHDRTSWTLVLGVTASPSRGRENRSEEGRPWPRDRERKTPSTSPTRKSGVEGTTECPSWGTSNVARSSTGLARTWG